MEKKVGFLTFFIKEFDNVQKMTVFKLELSNREKAWNSKEKPLLLGTVLIVARATGLEPVTYGLTVRCSTD